MYTTIRHELHHARKAWPVTLVDPCFLSGHVCSERGRDKCQRIQKVELRKYCSVVLALACTVYSKAFSYLFLAICKKNLGLKEKASMARYPMAKI